MSDAIALRDLPTEQWPTRELILREASRLFAARGYLGTSTREIAAAVGIQQPSLYNHFASKQAIAEALLDYDLETGLAFMRPLLEEEAAPQSGSTATCCSRSRTARRRRTTCARCTSANCSNNPSSHGAARCSKSTIRTSGN
ncbi:MAG: helix-turn-helix transcriptional regulator [Deltaproteobacteria bacterium]|nr:helix-turn-helix transcriptional regulator [Deltaproteobacteria bacterium]